LAEEPLKQSKIRSGGSHWFARRLPPASDATPMGRKGKKLTSWRNRLQISLQTIQVKLVKNLNNLVTYNQKYNFKFMVFKRNSKWAWLEGGPQGAGWDICSY
jgi:hypothetical protein